jgi:hypothetical protein
MPIECAPRLRMPGLCEPSGRGALAGLSSCPSCQHHDLGFHRIWEYSGVSNSGVAETMLSLESGECWGEDNRRRLHCGEVLGVA